MLDDLYASAAQVTEASIAGSQCWYIVYTVYRDSKINMHALGEDALDDKNVASRKACGLGEPDLRKSK